MSRDERGERLVTLARDAILHELGGPPPVMPLGEQFEQPGATFVTITRGGRLHGCIGSITPHKPLAADVVENAIAAAFRDPRSEPFRAAWVPELGVEVTLLGPLEPIQFTSEEDLLRQLVPGADGLVLRYGRHRGTFLPQVWDSLGTPRRFVGELKMKAGLPRDFWADDVEVFRFSVQKWGARHGEIAARKAHEAS